MVKLCNCGKKAIFKIEIGEEKLFTCQEHRDELLKSKKQCDRMVDLEVQEKYHQNCHKCPEKAKFQIEIDEEELFVCPEHLDEFYDSKKQNYSITNLELQEKYHQNMSQQNKNEFIIDENNKLVINHASVEDEEEYIILNQQKKGIIYNKTIGHIYLDDNNKSRYCHHNNYDLDTDQLEFISDEMKRVDNL